MAVIRARAGDREALESLLRRVQPDLSRYLSGVVGRQDADDVLQDVFLQIWRNVRWLREAELFRPWAYRIASRAAFAFLKKQRRWAAATSETPIVDSVPAPLDPEMARVLAGMPQLFEKVSPASRAVLVLHYLQNLSIEDVAAVLDINAGTAKSRLAYGLACLRKSLGRGK